MSTKLYLVVINDDHADPEYVLKSKLEDAMGLAKEQADWHKKHYGSMQWYVTDCTNIDGWLFMEYGEERWKVSVHELEVS